MKLYQRVAVFSDKYPLLGPLVWILTIQFFIAQVLTAAAWHPAYSWTKDAISDLGNTACGSYYGRYVCSPHHWLINGSFIVLGITMMLGSLLIYQEFKERLISLVGFMLMGMAGAGIFLVGAFPENNVPWIHDIGAVFGLCISNVSLIVLAFALTKVQLGLRVYTFISGAISVLAFILFAAHIYLGLGMGSMERVAGYPVLIWLTLFGIYMSSSHLYKPRNRLKQT